MKKKIKWSNSISKITIQSKENTLKCWIDLSDYKYNNSVIKGLNSGKWSLDTYIK